MKADAEARLRGLFAPLPTPFDGAFAVDEAALVRNLDAWNAQPLDGYVVGGSNGEFPLLTADERLRVLRIVVQHRATGRLVLGGASMESTAATAEMCAAVADAGAEAAIVVTPWYYKGRMSAAALVRHYATVADASPVPVVMYNMPANTGVDLPLKAVVELSQHANLLGIKESSPDLVKIGRMVQECRPGFAVLAGSAGFLLAALALGAAGGVTALANIAAAQLRAIWDAFASGNMHQARTIQASLLEINTLVTSQHGVAGLKAALDMLGLYGGPVRPPLLPVDEVPRREIARALVVSGLLSEENAQAR